ncbi:MAG TPA: Mrp/NBP35 family ATP-binding protein [Thermoanaerobaculia bacterium]|nr:Mrp/NBP35 family ATP-binding protein [Thermoanaerobaculia bacterium]HUM29511.1 Mrp/NBP35 family ATP-binding protein [Thermoanaerobaculia bacterium]HXK67894.1 Mrp/NBP35 family ATP-binding protein [Thermoanaerobaculia bacterium]
MVEKDRILQALQTVSFPGLTRDIVSFGFVKEIHTEGSAIHVRLELTSERENVDRELSESITEVLTGLDGVETVTVDVDLQKPQTQKQGPIHPEGDLLKQIRYKIAVASGKGGVGKSTVATNLACALKSLGWKVGMLDADIYGPSQQIMLGIREGKLYANEEKKILPVEANGIQVMSIGFLTDSDSPVIWRGLMVMKAIEQFIKDVAWGNLDALVIDLPPGTGDAQLTLCQTLPLSGVVIVTTPQDVALVDARKGLQMFRRLSIPVLGIVENMSTFVCPHCGEMTPIFRQGGGRRTGEELDVPLLAEIPIDPALPPSGDEGTPLVMIAPDSPAAIAFQTLARNVIRELNGSQE